MTIDLLSTINSQASTPGLGLSVTSSDNSMSAKIAELESAKEVQNSVSAVLSAQAESISAVNAAVQKMQDAIDNAIKTFKQVPPKLRKAVDVQGAAMGMYSKIGDMSKLTENYLSTNFISSEVPITPDDYYANPYEYDSLLYVQYKNNIVTDDDCLSSGYMKVKWTPKPEFVEKLNEAFKQPEDDDVVEQAVEKTFNTTVKTTWNTVKPPIQTVGNLASIATVKDMVTGLTDSIDGISELISTPVDEKALDYKIAQQSMGKGQIEDEANCASKMTPAIGKSTADAANQAKDAANASSQAIADQMKTLAANSTGTFKSIQTPQLPDDLLESIEDFKDAVMMVKDNISNIYTVLLLNMMDNVFSCFNEITGVIGVPTIPDPLGQIPQVVKDAKSIMEFVMGLPDSLITSLKSILKKKQKALQVAQTPTPPQPLPTKVPLPPSSKDVVVPSTSWDDVEKKLTDEYKFSSKDAESIVTDIQSFYDGSQANTEVIAAKIFDDVETKKGIKTAVGPDFKLMKQFMLSPIECYKTWLQNNVQQSFGTIDEDGNLAVNPILKIPHMGEYSSSEFYDWNEDGSKEPIDVSQYFGMHTYIGNVEQQNT